MAISNLQRFSGTIASGGSTTTVTCALSGTVNFIALQTTWGPDVPATYSATFGGDALTLEEIHRFGWAGGGDVSVGVWSGFGTYSGSNDLVLTLGAGTVTGELHVTAGYASNGQAKMVYSTSGGGLNATFSASYESTLYEGIAFAVAQSLHQTVPTDNGSVTSYDIGTTSNGSYTFYSTGGATPSAAIETHSISFSTTTRLGVAFMVIEDGSIEIEPSSIITEVTVPSPTFTGATDMQLYQQTIVLDVVVPDPVMSLPVPRQVALVGKDVDVPDRVDRATGLTEPVLTEITGVPTFVEHGTLDHSDFTARIVVMRVGITDPPEPVSNVDGDGWVYNEE